MFNALDVRLAASQQQQAVAAAAGKTAGGKQAHKKKGRKAAAEPQPAQVRCRPYMLGLCLHECAVHRCNTANKAARTCTLPPRTQASNAPVILSWAMGVALIADLSSKQMTVVNVGCCHAAACQVN
jgi:hypothetical protein